jgi:enterochelin esterase-like enzyme
MAFMLPILLPILETVVNKRLIVLSFCYLLISVNVLADGELSSDQRIESKHLNYALQYRVYVPDGVGPDSAVPTLYLTDGQWYIKYGHIVKVLDREIERGRIEPVVVVLVDSRDPDDISNNRRKDEFFGKESYAAFYTKELVPLITERYPVSLDRTKRVIGGISFGGLNAAIFGLLASETFYGIAMQSPANKHHLRAVARMYQDNEVLPIKLFFSVGRDNDNTYAARKFKSVLKEKGYDLNYVEVPFGHDWENWRPLIDDMLRTFFSR